MIGLIILLILTLILLAVMLSPLEALSWWAGWYHQNDHAPESVSLVDLVTAAPDTVSPQNVSQYVVFLTGIGGISQTAFLPRERAFLDRLIAALPEAHVVDDVYPYAATGRGLTEGRLFSWFWRYVGRRKAMRSPIGFLINVRNLLQVLVAADPRYSPIYSRGMAYVLLSALKRHGYPFGSGLPVTLIGYSGGAEMAVSAVSLLKRLLNAPIRVISLGGVMSNDPAVADVDHLYHLYGSKDRVQIIGPIVFPGRWRIARRSTWNRTRAAGKITAVPMGSLKHNGPGGYLDVESTLPDGCTHLDHTVTVITDLIRDMPDTPAAKNEPQKTQGTPEQG